MSDDLAVTDRRRPSPHRPRTTGDRVRLVLRGIGQTLVTLGVVVLLFVVYEVYITTWQSERENRQLVESLEDRWKLPGGGPEAVPVGDALGILYMPRLGNDYAWAIVEGSAVPDDEQLEKGPAHYGRTQLPGEVGNFAMAGHRVGKGEPFLNLDKLAASDTVIVATKRAWYVYRVAGLPNDVTAPSADGIVGREIVAPSDGSVLLPVPHQPSAKPVEKLLTMTTCHPKFTADNRMVVHATLDFKVDGSGNTMPSRVRALYEGTS